MFLDEIIDLIDSRPGFSLDLTKPGTKFEIKTLNSTYNIEVLDRRRVMIQGGTRPNGKIRFPEPIFAVIAGSTFGGTMIKLGWVGQDMRLELYYGLGGHLTTSSMKKATMKSETGDIVIWGDMGSWIKEGF